MAAAELLGEAVRVGCDSSTGIPQARLDEVMRRFGRVACVPGDKERRLQVIARTVMPCLYTRVGVQYTAKQVRTTRIAMWTAARGGHIGYVNWNEVCWPVLVTCFVKGHLCDLPQFLDYRAVMSFVAWSPDARSAQQIQIFWTRRSQGTTVAAWRRGPLDYLWELLVVDLAGTHAAA